jgi:hypothetical protein
MNLGLKAKAKTYINRDEILQRLAHFEPFNVQVARVNEIINP